MSFDFYAYVLLDPRKPGVYEYGEYSFDYEPFYVGKGKNGRCKEHLRKSSLKKVNYKNHKIKKILSESFEPIIVKVKVDLLECISFKYEMELIKLIGRTDLGLGPLTNMTDGGEGGGSNPSEEIIKKKSEATKKYHIEHPGYMSGDKHYLYGKHLPKEICDKISKKLTGISLSLEHKLKLSKVRKGRISWNKGIKWSEEQKQNLKKRPVDSEETRNKKSNSHMGIIPWNKGIKLSEDQKQNLKGSHKGRVPWNKGIKGVLPGPNKGIKQSPETIQKRAETRKRNKELKLNIKLGEIIQCSILAQ